MKKTRIIKSFLIVSLAALTFVACGKKTTKSNKTTNNKTTITTKSNITSNKKTNKDEVSVLAANKYYASNEGFIVRADATSNKLENLAIFSIAGSGVYIRPYIENNKFKAISIINSRFDSETDIIVNYIGKTTKFTPISHIAVSAIDDIFATKALNARLSDDKIEFYYNNTVYTINLDGTIDNYNNLDEITNGTFNIGLNKFTFNDGDLTVGGSYAYKALITKDDFSFENDVEKTTIHFDGNKIIKNEDSDRHPTRFNYDIELNDDLSVKKIIEKGIFDDVEKTYTYSDDFKTVNIIGEALGNGFIPVTPALPDPFIISGSIDSTSSSIIPKANKLIFFSSDYEYTYNYDDNFVLTSFKEIEKSGTDILGESTYTYTYDKNNILISYIMDSSRGSSRKINLTYNKDNYMTKAEIYQKSYSNEDYKLYQTSEYTFNDDNELISYKNKYADSDFSTIEATKDIDGNKTTITYKSFNGDGTIDTYYSYKTSKEFNNNGDLVRIVYYKSDLENYSGESLFTYSKENGFDVTTEIENDYDDSLKVFIPAYKYITKRNSTTNIYFEYDYNYETNDYVLDEENIFERLNNGKTRSTYNYYSLNDDGEAELNSVEIYEKGTNYQSTTIYKYSNEKITSGSKVEKDGDIAKVSSYNTVKEDFLLNHYEELFEDTDLKKVSINYEYDANGNLIRYEEYNKVLKNKDDSCTLDAKIIIAQYTNGEETAKTISEYTYNSNDDLTSSIISEYVAGALKEKNVYTRNYNNNGELIEETDTKYNGEAIVSEKVKAYNDNGDLIESIEATYANETKVTEKIITKEYDSNYNCTKSTSTNWKDGEYINKEIYEYTYDSNNNKISYIQTYYDNYTDITYYREALVVSDGTLTKLEKTLKGGQLVVINDNLFNEDLTYSLTKQYEYDENGIITKLTTTSYIDGEKDTITDTFYTNNNVNKEIKYQFFANLGQAKQTKVYELVNCVIFDTPLQLTSETIYDENGVKEKEIYYKYESQKSTKETYYYDESGINIINGDKDVNKYDQNGVLTEYEEYRHFCIDDRDAKFTKHYTIIDSTFMVLDQMCEYNENSRRIYVVCGDPSTYNQSEGKLVYNAIDYYDGQGNVTNSVVCINDFENNTHQYYHVKDDVENNGGLIYLFSNYDEFFEPSGEPVEGTIAIDEIIGTE